MEKFYYHVENDRVYSISRDKISFNILGVDYLPKTWFRTKQVAMAYAEYLLEQKVKALANRLENLKNKRVICYSNFINQKQSS